MKPLAGLLTLLLVAACGTTGGSIVPDGQNAVPAGKAVVALSVQVTDGTRYDNCSVFVGRNAATSRWFAWPVRGDDVVMVVLEVEPGAYGFHRFGCTYRALQLSTSVSGPQLSIAPGDVVYLGRLAISETGMGSAAGYSRMPTSVGLSFEDRWDEDRTQLAARWPVFDDDVTANVPTAWGSDPRYPLRPYQHGAQVVASPTF